MGEQRHLSKGMSRGFGAAPGISSALGVGLLLLTGMDATVTLAAAQPEGSAPRQVDNADRLRLSGRIDVARLVDLAAEQTGVRVEYDPDSIRGVVTLRDRAGLDPAELWQLKAEVLAARGLTTVLRPSGVFAVVRLQEAEAATLPADALPDGPTPGFVSIVREARHRDAAFLVAAAGETANKQNGSIKRLGDSGLIVLSGLAERVAVVERLLDRLDRPGDEPRAEVVSLRHVGQAEIALALEELRAKRAMIGAPGVRGDLIALADGRSVLLVAPEADAPALLAMVEALDRPRGVAARRYTPKYFSLNDVARLIGEVIVPDERGGPELRVVIDDLTGSLIVTGTDAQHAAIRELFEALDATPEEARRATRSYPIRERSAAELVGVLAGLLDADVSPAGGSTAPAQAGDADAGAPAAEAGRARRSAFITHDEHTNVVIAVGEPQALDRIGALIRELDVRQPQVQIEVLIISLSESDTLDLGVEIAGLINSGSVRARLSSLFGLSSGGSAANPSVGDATGFTGVVLSPGEFSVVVRALETINQGRTLSIPKILVSNNESGSLDSVLQQPFVSINAADTVATTTFGGTQDAGTSVQVTPRISTGDHLLLEYSVSLSSFVGDSAGPEVPPPRQQNRISSVVKVPDGYTVALGGLELKNESSAESRLPLIGSIPLLGDLGKRRSRSGSTQRFYVFIRPMVLRHEGFEDLKYLGEIESASFAAPEGWPSVAPRVIR